MRNCFVSHNLYEGECQEDSQTDKNMLRFTCPKVEKPLENILRLWCGVRSKTLMTVPDAEVSHTSHEKKLFVALSRNTKDRNGRTSSESGFSYVP